jgi:hypothetical protein
MISKKLLKAKDVERLENTSVASAAAVKVEAGILHTSWCPSETEYTCLCEAHSCYTTP